MNTSLPIICPDGPSMVYEGPVCVNMSPIDVKFQSMDKPPKARMCVKCRVYVPSACFASDLDSVCNRHEHSDMGLRYCTGCDEFVDVRKFPGRGVGNLCKEHLRILMRERETNQKRMKVSINTYSPRVGGDHKRKRHKNGDVSKSPRAGEQHTSWQKNHVEEFHT